MTPDKSAEAREREDFEQAMIRPGGAWMPRYLDRRVSGGYIDRETRAAFEGWKAGRASLATEAAQGEPPACLRPNVACGWPECGDDCRHRAPAAAEPAQPCAVLDAMLSTVPEYAAVIEAERAPAPISDEQRTRNLQVLVDFLHWCATSGIPPSAAAASHFEEIAMELLLAEAAK